MSETETLSVKEEPPKDWTIDAVLRWAALDFRTRGIDSPRLDAELIVAHALGTTRVQLILDAHRLLEPADLELVRGLVKRRRRREPVAYLRGEREFFGRPFRVDPRVLIPRPDTEILVDVALSRTAHVGLGMRGLDLCTGSGCVALSLSRERPTAKIHAVDISDEALVVARENMLRLGGYNASFSQGDLFDTDLPYGGTFDLVTANPPYIPSEEIPTLAPEIAAFEPRIALDGGPDGMSVLSRIVQGAPAHLRPGGVLCVEVGHGEAQSVASEFRNVGFSDVEVARDYGRIERVVSGVWRKKKGG